MIWAAVFAGAGFFGYNALFPTDRSQVRSCITSMMESSRGQVGYGELQRKLRDLDAGQTIEVTDENRRSFGDSTLVTIEYRVDGRSSRVMCSSWW